MTTLASAPAPAERRAPEPPADRRRWLGLVFIALAQLMVALDATIVNIALPSAQAALGFADAERQWVITSYTLAFGGLLLLGGRVADSIGRRLALLIGLAGFAAASASGGLATSLGVLGSARALQGAFAALLAPTALSLLAVTFTEPRDRAKAFGVYGGIASGGAAVGFVLGGFLAEYVDWRWCLYVNVPIALITAGGAWVILEGPGAARRAAPGLRFDVLGALLGSGCLVALVYGSGQVARLGWAAPSVLAPLGAGITALVLFVVQEARVETPLLPLRIVLDRRRGAAYLSMVLAIAGMFGAFLFLTYELQVVLGFSPLLAGLALLPMTAATLIGSGAIATRLLPRVSPRTLMVPGFAVAAGGMAVLTQLRADSGYLTTVFPAAVLLGLGIACVMAPAASIATRVDPGDAGIAAAALTTAQQVGASLGTAILNTVAASATAAYLAANTSAARADGLVHGYAAAAVWGAVLLMVGAAVAASLSAGHPARPAPHTVRHEIP